MPCVAHNFQLIINDGLKLSLEYEALIEKVSKNIVTKSKCCVAIAEELRALHIQLCKKNLTRWNSTLFMIRSVLKLTPTDFQNIKAQLPTKTAAQLEVKNNFGISKKEREMLIELKDVLQMFEFVTDEIQTNDVSISRVYPCINYLRKGLSDERPFKYTTQLRSDLLVSLNERFVNIEDKKDFVFSTFLDPNFGIKSFEADLKVKVKSQLACTLKLEILKKQAKESVVNVCLNNNINSKRSKKDGERTNNYIYYGDCENEEENDDVEREIEEYIRTIKSSSFDCALKFWKSNQFKFPNLANLAMKYLGIPASSAAVERMFSIAGHIFSLKRRRMGVKIFCELVFLKLNEFFL